MRILNRVIPGLILFITVGMAGQASHAAAPPPYEAWLMPVFENGKAVGVRVTKLVIKSPMGNVGLKENDVIISYKDKPVANRPDLIAEMRKDIDNGSCGKIQVKQAASTRTLSCPN
jgi:hypothetical protein